MTNRALAISLLTACLLVPPLAAHPGSGIVVDRQGQLFFVDTGHGVWKFGANSKLASVGGPRFHWMAIDHEGRFAKTTLPSTPDSEITKVGSNPLLLLSSDFPLVIANDGALYYPELARDGPLQVLRLTSAGARTVLATLPAASGGAALKWLNGIAADSTGAIYYTEDRAVKKISPQGVASTVAENIVVPGCVQIPSYTGTNLGPNLRGLDVGADGTVYVAATGCGTLLKISTRGEITPVLRTTSPWSPTAVAVSGGDVYVQEYLHTSGEDRVAWIPRIRKLSADGKVSDVAAVERK